LLRINIVVMSALPFNVVSDEFIAFSFIIHKYEICINAFIVPPGPATYCSLDRVRSLIVSKSYSPTTDSESHAIARVCSTTTLFDL